jgi:hypothetical protein
MNTGFLIHVSDDTLERYALQRIPEMDLAEVKEHLLSCLPCQIRLEEMDEYIKVMQAAIAEVSCVVGTF